MMELTLVCRAMTKSKGQYSIWRTTRQPVWIQYQPGCSRTVAQTWWNLGGIYFCFFASWLFGIGRKSYLRWILLFYDLYGIVRSCPSVESLNVQKLIRKWAFFRVFQQKINFFQALLQKFIFFGLWLKFKFKKSDALVLTTRVHIS
jgi:hypothetical protein